MRGAKREGSKRENGPAPGVLALAGLLAAANVAWAGFQWRQLEVARRGGEAFCALGAGDACAQLGDSPFARVVEALSGMPVAGWGVVWGLAALALALLTLRRLRRGDSPEPLWSGVALTAVAGAAGVVLLLSVSLRLSVLCGNCLLTYVGVGAYAGLVLVAARSAPPRRLGSGGVRAALAGAAAFVALLPVAARTPRAVDPTMALLEPKPSATPESANPSAALAARVASLPFQARQMLSDALDSYLHPAEEVPIHPPRELLGSPMAPLRITVFSDPLCSHCAELHRELEQLLAVAPPNTLAIESRKFPLNSSCNPSLPETGGPELRCLIARVLICLEKEPDYFQIEGRVMAEQRELDEDRLFTLTAPYASRAVLERCAASPETQAKLDDDIQWAVANGIQGTPLVLVNGRKVPTYLPFLYVLTLAGGDTNHPAFRGLPPPRLETAARADARPTASR